MAKKTESPKLVTRKHLARKEREEKQIKSALIATGVVIGLVLLLLAYVLIDSLYIQPNKTVARVGEAEIKAGDFESNVIYSRLNMISTANNYAYYAQLFGDSGSQFKSAGIELVAQLNNSELMGEDVLNQMIDDQLIREEAEKLGVTVSEDEIQEVLQSSFAFFPSGTKTPTITPTIVNTPTWSSEQFALINPTETATPEPTFTATPDGWEPTQEATATSEVEEVPEETTPTVEPTATQIPTITPTATVYTTKLYGKELDNYLDNLKSYGITRDQVEDIFRASLLRTKMSEELTKDMLPEEEQVWVRHILVDSQDLAQEVIEKLDNGEDWAALAAEYSTDTSNKDNGGDLGWIGQNDSFVDEFKVGAFQLYEAGEISEPIETSFGWHVIQLVTRATNDISATKFQQNKQIFFENWLVELRDSRTDIQIEEIWKTLTPDIPAVPTELINFFFSQ